MLAHIRRITIKQNEEPHYSSFVDLYMSAFPLHERRNPDTLPNIFACAEYHAEAWVDNEKLLGFIAWWDNDKYRFVEHYAIHPDSRSLGLGSRFMKEWINDCRKPVILEIEPVTDVPTERRLSFYRRLAFAANEHLRHEQPPYHKDTPPVALEILSFPHKITEEQYRHFKQTQADVYMPDFTR